MSTGEKALVSIVRCSDYLQEEVDTAVSRSIDMIGGIRSFVKPGMKVLLKVNALTPRYPEAAVTTHPTVIKALVKAVKNAGGIAFVGDSSGGMVAGQAPTRQTFEVAGIARAAEESGAELINFDISGVKEVEAQGPVSPLYIAQPVFDADLVVSVPKLKTHSAAVFTGAVKNMYGAIPGFRKAEFHRMAPKLRDFAQLLVDIYSITRPGLAVMDAITGMEGNGPSAGNPRDIGLVLASKDSVALDCVASKVINLDPFKVYTTVIAHNRGVGIGDPSLIEITGEDLRDVTIHDFDLPSNAMLETMPGFLISGMLGLLRARPEICGDACKGCRFCVESCPVDAMTMTGNVPEIDYNKCISCLCCQELCPQKAVEMKQVSSLGKAIAGIFGHHRRKKRAHLLAKSKK